jgi:L-fuconolactonase
MFAVDAHQHFWSTQRDDYGWLTPELGAIYRDFHPSDLQPLLAKAGIGRTILVQAAQSEAETLYLLEIAAHTPFVAGVVGWVDLEADGASDRVTFMADKGVIGLRPMVQDIADTQWLLHAALRPGINAMIENGLCFDALVQPRHLPLLPQFSADYPGLKIVIDHGAKPDIANGGFQPWADNIARIAAETNAYCKLSGLVTEAAVDWKQDDLRPYITHLITCFGAERLIWGSDWPVLNLASDYATWHAITGELLSSLTNDDRDLIMGGNAARFYGIT